MYSMHVQYLFIEGLDMLPKDSYGHTSVSLT